MCGRFSLIISAKNLAKYLKETFLIDDTSLSDFKPNFNISPTDQVLSIIHDQKAYRLGRLRWGFDLAKDDQKVLVINAKAETIFSRPTFREAIKTNRCVILADSFYEWKPTKPKTPYQVFMTDQVVLALAGVYRQVLDENHQARVEVCIITTSANRIIADIHDRMPVILNQKAQKMWLDPKITDETQLRSLLIPYDETLTKTKVLDQDYFKKKNKPKEPTLFDE